MSSGVSKGQKRMADPLELELQVVCELPGSGGGNRTEVFRKRGVHPQLPNHGSASVFWSFSYMEFTLYSFRYVCVYLCVT